VIEGRITMRLSIDDAAALARAGLNALGYSARDSDVIALHLMDCELRGLEYAGLARVLSIAERLSANPLAGSAPRITRESPVSAQLDGGDTVGYVVAQQATRIAIDKARASGIGAVGANRTWYTGMLSYYAEQIVTEGMVAMIASNATPWVAPFGGSEPRFGTNPICFGFPSRDAPVIWDIGISEIIHAQVVMARRTGRPLPDGVALDRNGRPTRDPVAALAGAFVNWGGHKGSGLAIAVQLFGVMAGSPILPGELQDFGCFILAIRPDLFVEADTFRESVSAYAAEIRATRRLDDDVPVRMPFERSAALRAERLARGWIDVDDIVHDAVRALLNPRRSP
jgi:LDH2 family malate/lactate/ureidoglycolate dehydrogenase